MILISLDSCKTFNFNIAKLEKKIWNEISRIRQSSSLRKVKWVPCEPGTEKEIIVERDGRRLIWRRNMDKDESD